MGTRGGLGASATKPAEERSLDDTKRQAGTFDARPATARAADRTAGEPNGSRGQSARAEAAEADETVGTTAAPQSSGAADAEASDAADAPSGAPEVQSYQLAADDPLFSCLSLVTGFLQRPITPSALRAGLPRRADATDPSYAVRAAENNGFVARVVQRAKITAIPESSLPCILLFKGGDACVLLSRHGAEARIVLPEGGEAVQRDIATLEQDYTGTVLFVRNTFRFDQRAQALTLADPKGWFWGTLARFWPIYGHVLIASLVINTFALASPLFIMNVYDRVVPNQAFETLWALALGVGIVFAFDFLLRNLRNYFVDTAGKNADVIIANRLLGQILSMKLSKKEQSTGSLANNVREFESLREFFTSGTLVAFVDLPFIFLFIGVIWLIAGPVAYVPLAIVPLVLIVGVLLQLPMRRLQERTYQESAQKHALLVESVEGLETIKATAAEGSVQRNWEQCVAQTSDTARKTRLLSTFSTTFAQTAIQVSVVAVVVFGVYRIAEGNLSMGALVAATILTGRALAPLGQVAALLTRLQQSRVALNALDRLMKTPVERPADRHFLHRPRIDGNLQFDRVTFAYPGRKANALEDVSFNIQTGEKVAVIGRIGSGKSTLARLMVGLYEPDEGGVLVDGTDLRQYDPADVRSNISFVGQDNYLFYGTVRDNICFSAPFVDDATMRRASWIAGVDDFVAQSPEGYDLPVGERGTHLSGGQRQAICIARAMLLDPPVVAFDEPTSHMDNSSERRFIERLGSVTKDKTLVIATHRSSLLSLVSRIIVLDQGRIVADGEKNQVLQALSRGELKASGRTRAGAASQA
jgi:ATP-binding cassette subfamily C protein LapB